MVISEDDKKYIEKVKKKPKKIIRTPRTHRDWS